MSIVDDYNNAREILLSHFDTDHLQVFELIDNTEYYWMLTDDAIFFDERMPSDLNDWTYCEQRASCGLAVGKDFTLVSIHECTGNDSTRILDNTKEITY